MCKVKFTILRIYVILGGGGGVLYINTVKGETDELLLETASILLFHPLSEGPKLLPTSC